MKSIETKIEKLQAKKVKLNKEHNKKERSALTRRIASLRTVLTILEKDSYWHDQCIQGKAADKAAGQEYVKALQSETIR